MTDIKVTVPTSSQLNSDLKENPTDTTPKENPTLNEEIAAAKAEREAELDAEYVDKRTIVISSVLNWSSYRRVNMAALGKPRNVIGSSVKSVRKLMANKGEVEAYFPELIGVSVNNPDFITRVKSFLNNISFNVGDTDAKLDTTFVYHHKRDYLKIQAEEEKIYAEYEKVDRSDTEALLKAANKRDDELNRLESTKYKYGYPLNINEYLIYRHCLLYSEVAKDEAFINSNPNLRFYIKDSAKEEVRKEKILRERKNAMRNFVELDASPAKTNAVYIAYLSYKGTNISDGISKSDRVKTQELLEFINSNPSKFNKIYNDKNILDKAFIETLIARGELIRTEFNQQISTPDGQFIGANLNEAVAYFKNPNNAGFRNQLENKLKLI